MTKTFSSISERRRGYKAGTAVTSTAPAAPSTPVLGAITNPSGTVRRVAITTFPATANSLLVEVSLNGGTYVVNSVTPVIGATYFDIDTGSATTYSFRAKGVNDGGLSASYSNVVSGGVSAPTTAPALGAITNPSGTIRRVAVSSIPSDSTYITREVSLNGGAYISAGTDIVGAVAFFDYDTGAATAWSFRCKAGNSGGLSAAYSNVVTGSASGNWWDAGQLATGHFETADLTPILVHPQPDIVTGAFASTRASHRVAYRDGVNAVQYETQFQILGGAAPWMYNATALPAGASIPYPFYRGVDANGDTLPYGYVIWNPTQDYSAGAPASFTVTARDQSGATIVITWTVRTSSSTADFIFMDNVDGLDSNAGTISAPFRTTPKIFGTSSAQTTYPNRQVYFRGKGTPYPLTSHAAGVITLSGLRHPVNIHAFPGETVEISLAGGQFLFDNSSDAKFDASFGNELIFSGSSTAAAETHGFWGGSATDRVGFANVWFKDPISRDAGAETNSTSIHTSSDTVNRKHWMHWNVRETGRTMAAGSNQGMLLFCHFSLDESYAEFCRASTIVNDPYTVGPQYKDDNTDVGFRNCSFVLTNDNGNAAGLLCQSKGARGEINSCKIGGAVALNWQSGCDGPLFVTRCTIDSTDNNLFTGIRAFTSTSSGPFSGKGNTIVAGNTTSTNFTETRTLSYLWAGDGAPHGVNSPLDPVTLLLRNISGGTQYKTLYEGTANSRGHRYS